MKICITSQGKTLDAMVDPRFGRCACFIIADPDSFDFEAYDNSAAVSGGGAGIQAGQFVAEKGVKALLTGNVGPNAFQVLSAAGIEMITGVSGTVREAIAGFKKGTMKSASSPSVESHFGMNKKE
ncbi:MAG: dinitrogenase iron-molybdenum cofactor biosynthesis protein [Spirochaetaceae bacterium]|nr:MAG: dinitrogenase iron-molybdenum cofactor biosynthesis protein [Spirochaetaceae bacterium]